MLLLLLLPPPIPQVTEFWLAAGGMYEVEQYGSTQHDTTTTHDAIGSCWWLEKLEEPEELGEPLRGPRPLTQGTGQQASTSNRVGCGLWDDW